MAQQMDSDFQLAGEAVVFTAAFGCITMFAWTFILKQLGMI